MTEDKLLQVEHLTVHYETPDGVVEAINDVSFALGRGESLGLVGETGAGKTSIALAIMGLLPKPPANVISGSMIFDGRELTQLSAKELREIRGSDISMIFQDPMTALNPVFTVGSQVAEVIRIHDKVSKLEANLRARHMLEMVGIGEDRFNEYPHQFSGGMKQRVVIAIALACNPRLLIADEPTTALDVTIQAQVLASINKLKKELGTSLILITHDFGVVARCCDRCAIVYAGEIVESGTLEQIYDDPKHPYTIGLFGSIPSIDADADRLTSIPGLMSDPMNLPPYCSFYERCSRRCDRCTEGNPRAIDVGDNHVVKCFLFDEGKESG